MRDQSTKYFLSEDRLPKAWYNLAADLPGPVPPPVHPGTGQPMGPDDLAPLFPMGVLEQEVSQERWIDIPDPVRDVYRLWRPSPLVRARRLEQALDTPARIFFKYEGVSPAGSHKPNTAVAQAFYNQQEGVTSAFPPRPAPGSGAARSAFACADLRPVESRCTWFASQFRPETLSPRHDGNLRRHLHPQPVTDTTEAGRAILSATRTRPAVSASPSARRWRSPPAATIPSTRWAACSTMSAAPDHHRRGSHAKSNSRWWDDEPDVVIGCAAAAPTSRALSFPFVCDKLKGKSDIRVSGTSSRESCPTLTKGRYVGL